jgi:antitoxin MazE
MKASIIPIGNSKGIRIPKALLDHCGFGDSVEIALKDNHIVLSPFVQVRAGWEDAFKSMADKKDDALLSTPPTAFDENEWKW